MDLSSQRSWLAWNGGQRSHPSYCFVWLVSKLQGLKRTTHSPLRTGRQGQVQTRVKSDVTALAFVVRDSVVICESARWRVKWEAYANRGRPRPRVRLGSLTSGQNLFPQWWTPQSQLSSVACSCQPPSPCFVTNQLFSVFWHYYCVK